MTETAAHAELVRAIIDHVHQEFEDLTELAVGADSVAFLRSSRPPRIGRYVPDVYATNVPTTKTLIGEAKTRRDLETGHSRAQISAFLKHLAHTPNGIFVLSVPLIAAATARRIVVQLSRPFVAANTRIVILDGIHRPHRTHETC